MNYFSYKYLSTQNLLFHSLNVKNGLINQRLTSQLQLGALCWQHWIKSHVVHVNHLPNSSARVSLLLTHVHRYFYRHYRTFVTGPSALGTLPVNS